jgi:hypothetical protein
MNLAFQHYVLSKIRNRVGQSCDTAGRVYDIRRNEIAPKIRSKHSSEPSVNSAAIPYESCALVKVSSANGSKSSVNLGHSDSG